MKIVLVTGANKGIGFETAKQLAELGHYVYLGCRDITSGTLAVKSLHNLGLTNTELILIDITNLETIVLVLS